MGDATQRSAVGSDGANPSTDLMIANDTTSFGSGDDHVSALVTANEKAAGHYYSGAIREEWSGILAMNGQITLGGRYAIVPGDVPVLGNQWTFKVGGERISSSAVST